MRSFVRSIACGGFLLACVPVLALAHAVPVTYSPDEFAVLDATPAEIMIRFSERIEPSASTIEILDPDGIRLPAAASGVADGDAHRFSRSVAPGSDPKTGMYSVLWQVVSADDGHFTRGTFPFFLGAGTTTAAIFASSVEIIHSASRTEAAMIALKLLGEALALGALAFLLAMSRSRTIRGIPNGTGEIARRLERTFLTGLGLLGAGAIGYFTYKTFQLAAAQGGIPLDALPSYAATTGGTLTIALLVLVIAAFVLARGIVPRLLLGGRIGPREFALGIVLLCASYTQARLSHAAAAGDLAAFSIGVNLLHLVGKGLWIGGLLTFALAVLPLARIPEYAQSIRIEGRRLLGMILAPAIALAGTSGAWIVWLHLKGIDNLFTTDWGRTLLALAAFAGALLALRLVSLFASERMRRCLDCERSFATLEGLFTVALLGISATIIITTPPLFARPLWSAHLGGQSGAIMLDDAGAGGQAIRIRAFDPSGILLPLDRATIVLNEPAQGIGPIVLPKRVYRAREASIPTAMLTPPGLWTIDMTVPQEGRYDVVGHTAVRYPDDLLAARTGASAYRFDMFAAACIVAALGSIGLGYVLWRRTRANSAYALAHPELLDGAPIGFWKGQGIALAAFGVFALTVAILLPAIAPRDAGESGMHAGHHMP